MNTPINKKFLIVYLLLQMASFAQCTKLKLYALYTPSHKILATKYFLPSIQDDFDIVLVEASQTSSSAQFMSHGWTATTIKKVELIIKAIKDNWGDIFIFSDVDIQFFAPIGKLIVGYMKNKDMVIQKDAPSGSLCSGFFACRANERTLQMWQHAYAYMKTDRKCSDQPALNRCLKPQRGKSNAFNVSWEYLPNSFFGGGTKTGKYWKRKHRLPIPRNIVMHHANWTRGIKNKIAQLEYVKQAVKAFKRRKKPLRCH